MPKKAAPGTKKKRVRREPEAARRLILEAAIRVLSKRGPEACGLKDVAVEAGISHALVTHYFGTYEALVTEAASEAMAQLRARLISRVVALPQITPERLLQLYFDVALEPWYGRLVGWSLFNEGERATELAQTLMPDMKLMVAATEYAIGGEVTGADRRERAEAMLVSVWAMMIGYVAGNGFFWRALGRKPGPSRDRQLREFLSEVARNITLER